MKTCLSKVPEITLTFWIIKILSTTVGETGGDFLAENLDLGLAITSCIMTAVLIITLIVQFKFTKYSPPSYWSVVIAMSIVGTLITDLLVDDMGISLVTITIIFAVTMILGFIVWYKREKTLSIHSINTHRRETYYWVIILLAFALGTGVGDLLSEKMELGYGIALLIFGGAIALISAGFFWLKMNATLAFWLAFILTRPLGASLGDFMIQPKNEGGLGLGLTIINIIFLLIIMGLVSYLTVTTKEKSSNKKYVGWIC